MHKSKNRLGKKPTGFEKRKKNRKKKGKELKRQEKNKNGRKENYVRGKMSPGGQSCQGGGGVVDQFLVTSNTDWTNYIQYINL